MQGSSFFDSHNTISNFCYLLHKKLVELVEYSTKKSKISHNPNNFLRVRGRLHVRICVRIGVRFVAKGGLKSNLGSIISEMCLQTVVMCVW
jgi:hypothetical protein